MDGSSILNQIVVKLIDPEKIHRRSNSAYCSYGHKYIDLSYLFHFPPYVEMHLVADLLRRVWLPRLCPRRQLRHDRLTLRGLNQPSHTSPQTYTETIIKRQSDEKKTQNEGSTCSTIFASIDSVQLVKVHFHSR